ncbi:MAG: hypothetical protein O7B30_05530 [Thaumarchaeota archaeon]|nr:hypothetical protein [Nitrososphaerota archaeon]
MTVRSRRKTRTRRTSGVAPIVASMLLISITVGAFSLVWGTTSSYLSSQRLGPLQQMRERVVIEEVYFFNNATGSYVGVYFRNSGKVELVGQDISFNGSIIANSSPSELSLQPGQAGWINASLAWSPGEKYTVSVISERGSRTESIYLVGE